ncbi:MAG: imidazolonepropionase [Proteobacteria bacterium]|nr:MAG: imidazolonepropionase [Pseudomonadota bacterium]
MISPRTVLRNIGILYRCLLEGGQAEIHALKGAAVAWENGSITWAGLEQEIPSELLSATTIDAGGKVVVPGLIDCHTHLAFGGWRAGEFEKRILGRSYLEIANSGGGIASTVESTRAATKQQLIERCLKFLNSMASLGVTTIECKSGYGLSLEEELKILQVYKELSGCQAIKIVSTLLAAHTVPPEFKDNRENFIELICERIIPEAAKLKLAHFCDVFVEDSAFTIPEAERILAAAARFGFRPKLHADQLSAGGGAELAAKVRAISADHLEHTSQQGIAAMAEAGVVAVSLPLASLLTAEKPMMARAWIDAGVKVAVATDFNPGSAPSFHLPLAMMLACTMNRMTPAEVLKGVTAYAACALGIEAKYGSIAPGMSADMAVIECDDVAHWLYHFVPNACTLTIKDGRVIYQSN